MADTTVTNLNEGKSNLITRTSNAITDIRRKQIIMNIIELIKVNYDNLSNLFNNKEKRKYLLSLFNIQKSILIFFPLKNSIFETNSEDTDKLALFKYNNIKSF